MNNTTTQPSIDEDEQLLAALTEYIGAMDKGEAHDFRARLAVDRVLLETIAKAMSEMAMLIAAAHVIEDDDEFDSVAEGVFGDAYFDGPDVQRLRTYYLENADMVDFHACGLPAPIVAQCICTQLAAYQILHA